MNIERQKHIPKYALGIDWETSGSDWGKDSTIDYQGIAFAAVIFDTLTFEEVDSIECFIKFDSSKYKWQDRAQEIHGISREWLEENGVTQEEAITELLNMIVKWMGPDPGKIMFGGHNVEFDVGFTKQLFKVFNLDFEVYHVKLDTSNCGFIVNGTHKSDDVFGMFAGGERDQHNALEDVRMFLESMRTMREIFQLGLAQILEE